MLTLFDVVWLFALADITVSVVINNFQFFRHKIFVLEAFVNQI